MAKIKYENCKATLKETSFDSIHGEYMVELQNEVINFDEFMKCYIKSFENHSDPFCSVDTLCKMNGDWCFIEFKNGNLKKTSVMQNISNKIGHSILILLRNEGISIKDFYHNAIFILVYNEDKNRPVNCVENKLDSDEIQYSESRNLTVGALTKKAKRNIIKFNMARYESIYFKNVLSLTKKQFENYISKQTITLPN
ncbi:hypothetical protein [Amedibacillus sp. YH-ame10]